MAADSPWPAIRAVLRILVAAPLLIGAAFLTFQPAAIRAFARTGLPDSARVLLSSAEITASILFMLPRTVYVGGFGLLAVLAAAMGLHAALHLGVGLQPLFFVLVAALLLAEFRAGRGARRRPAAGAALESTLESSRAGE